MNTAALPVAKINPLNQVLLTHVLNEARHGNYHHCRALGFTDEMLLRLQNLTPCALTMLTHAQTVWIKPLVDKGLFERLMTHIDKEEARERLVKRALLLGASNEMMEHFFALTTGQCAQYRRMYGASLLCKGRPKELADEEKHSAWKRWMALVKQAEKEQPLQDKPALKKVANAHNGAAGQTGKRRPSSYGGHLDAMTQLDFMMLIAEEQALSLGSLWNELTPYLYGEPPCKPKVRGSQKRQSLAEKNAKAQPLNRPHAPNSPKKPEPSVSLALF